MVFRVAGDIIGELGRDDGAGGNPVSMFECAAEFGDTRRAAVSATDADNGGIPFFRNFRPQRGIVREDHALCAA